MEYKEFKNRKNILGSEVGLVTKTITVPSTFSSYYTENGRKIVPTGTAFSTPYYGLLYQDVDITDGDKEASLIIGGRYIAGNLPYSLADAYVSAFIAQGLYEFTEGSVTRPSFGTVGLTALSAPTVSAVSGAITITAVSNAVDYTIFDSNKVALTTQSGSTYSASESGVYYVRANGDNINYKNSNLASVTVTL